jgi:hypothetical protein
MEISRLGHALVCNNNLESMMRAQAPGKYARQQRRIHGYVERTAVSYVAVPAAVTIA